MLVKRAIRTTLLTAAVLLVLLLWFYLLPRWQFAVGMPLREIEKSLGHEAHLIPIRHESGQSDSGYMATHMISVNRYAMHLYLNSEMRVVRIAYMFGSEQHPHFVE